MALITLPRSFAGLATAILSYLDDNFNALKTYINATSQACDSVEPINSDIGVYLDGCQFKDGAAAKATRIQMENAQYAESSLTSEVLDLGSGYNDGDIVAVAFGAKVVVVSTAHASFTISAYTVGGGVQLKDFDDIQAFQAFLQVAARNGTRTFYPSTIKFAKVVGSGSLEINYNMQSAGAGSISSQNVKVEVFRFRR